MAGTNMMFVLGSFVAACSVKVERLPLPGESLLAKSFIIEAGGKGFNIAAGAHRQGARVDGLLAVGDDLFSTLAEAALTKLGLPLSMLLPQPGATGAGVGFIDAEGENCLAVFPGANALLSADHVADASARISRARLMVAQFEIGDGPIMAAFAKARLSECRTILNPSPYRLIDPRILSATDILILNRIEARLLAHSLGFHDFPARLDDISYLHELAITLFKCGPSTLIITLGADGALCWQRGYPLLRQAAFAVEAVDTLGAGDAFTAGFVACMLEDRSVQDCLRWAAASGACATTAHGVLEALPDRPALETALSEWRERSNPMKL